LEGEAAVDFRTVWFVLIVPAIVLGLLSWPQILRTVRERGLEYPAWGGHGIVLSHFRRLVREESNPQLRRQYRRWLWMSYAASALAVLWIAFVLMGSPFKS
jgi:hypothetical protein